MECGIEARVEKIQDSVGGEEVQVWLKIVHSEKLQMRWEMDL